MRSGNDPHIMRLTEFYKELDDQITGETKEMADVDFAQIRNQIVPEQHMRFHNISLQPYRTRLTEGTIDDTDQGMGRLVSKIKEARSVGDERLRGLSKKFFDIA